MEDPRGTRRPKMPSNRNKRTRNTTEHVDVEAIEYAVKENNKMYNKLYPNQAPRALTGANEASARLYRYTLADYQSPSTIYGGAATPTSCNSPYLATTPSGPSNSNLYKE